MSATGLKPSNTNRSKTMEKPLTNRKAVVNRFSQCSNSSSMRIETCGTKERRVRQARAAIAPPMKNNNFLALFLPISRRKREAKNRKRAGTSFRKLVEPA